jgi:hypothetical protein
VATAVTQNVADLVVKRELARARVGETGSAPVHDDQPRERRETVEERREPGLLPGVLDVRDEPRHEQEVQRRVAGARPGDRGLRAPRVARLDRH